MNQDYTQTFYTHLTPEVVFNYLINVQSWWSGLYSEVIEGASSNLHDVFTFRAGGEAHYSKQELVELVPNERIVWLVTDSKLTFVKNESEWTGTHLCFDISKEDSLTKVTFTHIGLIPAFECYGGCSHAWTSYLEKFLHSKATM